MSEEKRKTKDRYAKLGGRFWRHAKVLGLSDGAGWLWTRALSYCVDNHTDGFVAVEVGKALRPRDIGKRASELIAARLWIASEGGWRFHDYDDHNTTNQEWEEEKARKARNTADSRAQRKPGAQASHQPVTGDIPPPVTGNPPSVGSVTSDSGLRTQDSGLTGGETPPPVEHLTDAIRCRWERDYARRRGPGAPVNDADVRKASTWIRTLAAHHERDPMHVLDALLAAYWSDPWTASGRPSIANLISQGDRLAAVVFPPKPKTIDPNEWNARHGIPTRRTA